MQTFTYYMPTKICNGRIDPAELSGYGKKAFIVTGKSSRKNGALQDIMDALDSLSLLYKLFDRVEENPSVENVLKGAAEAVAWGADHVIGIGGGSPMDAAKAIAVIIANPDKTSADLYNTDEKLRHVPVLMLPTTAGTGSEVTPFAVLTVHEKATKMSISHLVYPAKAFLDGKYMLNMPHSILVSTAIDTFSHLAEGYLSAKANDLSDRIAESGLASFAECRDYLLQGKIEPDTLQKLLLTSTIAGMVITQAKTSLPHQMGYALTYHKKTPHGVANGVLLGAFFEFHGDKQKVGKMLALAGFQTIEDFQRFIAAAIPETPHISREEILLYAEELYAKPDKLKVHPWPVSLEDIVGIYEKSLAGMQ